MLSSNRRALLLIITAAATLFALTGTANAGILTVTRTNDLVDGTCNLVDCGLREAITAANNTPGNDTVVIPTGTYALTGASGEDLNVSGDLDVLGPDDLTITGAGAATTTIQGPTGDRVIDYLSNGDLSVTGVTITGGTPAGSNGGGMNLNGNGDVTIQSVRVTENHISGVAGLGGGIYASLSATLTIRDVRVDSNSSPVEGGGLAATALQGVLIDRASIHGNTSGGYNGGAVIGSVAVAPTVIKNTVFHANESNDGGGALGSTSNQPFQLRNVTISANVANADRADGGTGAIFAQDTDFNLGNVLAVDNINLPDGPGAGTLGMCTITGSGTIVSAGANVVDSRAGCSTGLDTDTLDTGLDGGTFGGLGGNGLFQVPIATDDAAFDAGALALCAEAGTMDGRGAPRSIGASCDAGAYELGGLADLAATLGAAPTSLVPGVAASTSGTFQNLGPDVAVNARLELSVPTGATAVLPSAPAGGSCTVGATKVICTVPVLNVNETLTASTTFTPASVGAFTLRATAASAGTDPAPGNDSASRDVTIAVTPPPSPPTDPTPSDPDPTTAVSPRITFATTATGQPVRVGRTGTFTVRVSCPVGVAGGSCRVSMTGRSVARFTYGGVRTARSFATTCATRSIPAGTTAAVTCTVPAAVRTAVRDRVVALRMTARSTASSGGASVTRTGTVRIRTPA